MTEQHTQQEDSSETFVDSAVAMTQTLTSDPALELVEMAETNLTGELSDDEGNVGSANIEPDAAGSHTEAEAVPVLIEALLFVADQPIEANALARALEITSVQARRALDQLAESLRDEARGVRLQLGPDGAQLVTAPETAAAVEHFLGLEASRRLSNAALETLAIVAYRQPVTRHVIDQIRGVDSGGALATLRARNLIEAIGRAPGPGRPVLFTTTQRFLEHFGLERAQDLPALPEDVELPPEDAGAQLALDQALRTELSTSVDNSLGQPNTEATVTSRDKLEEDDHGAATFDVEDKDVEISSDLEELSRAAGAAFGANEEPDSSGN
jgi:segregation and condensation protein B